MDHIALFRIIFWKNKNFINFPAFRNTIKWIAIENVYGSSLIFQPLLYVIVPAESPSYAPTFFCIVDAPRQLIIPQVTWLKAKLKLLVFIQMFVCSIYFDPLSLKLPNFL